MAGAVSVGSFTTDVGRSTAVELISICCFFSRGRASDMKSFLFKPNNIQVIGLSYLKRILGKCRVLTVHFLDIKTIRMLVFIFGRWWLGGEGRCTEYCTPHALFPGPLSWPPGHFGDG